MGLDGISIWQLLIVLLIIVLLFGTTKLKNVGGDLGSALRSFRKAMHDDEDGQSKGDKNPRGSLGAGETSSSDAEFSRSGEKEAEESANRRR